MCIILGQTNDYKNQFYVKFGLKGGNVDRLTYLKAERSSARRELKNYLIMFRDFLEQECETPFPTQEEIKNYTKEEFDVWFIKILPHLKEKESEDLVLIELIEAYICAANNVSIMETTAENDIYY